MNTTPAVERITIMKTTHTIINYTDAPANLTDLEADLHEGRISYRAYTEAQAQA